MSLAEDKKVILSKYGPYVRSLAASVRKQFSANLELEELVSYGQVGLLEAAERFDPKVGANFLTFAHYRIKGAIFDGLRKMGVLKGADARSAYLDERATVYLSNLADREGGGGRATSFDDDVRDLANSMTGLAVVYAMGGDAADGAHLPDESLPADQRIELEQLKKRVRAAIETLPEKERKLLQGYYFNAKTLEEAGAEIGQSKSWASRLHARAVDKLKDLLREEAEGETAEPSSNSGAPSAAKGRRTGHGARNDGKSHFGDGNRPAKQPSGGDGSNPTHQAGGVKV